MITLGPVATVLITVVILLLSGLTSLVEVSAEKNQTAALPMPVD